MGTDAACPDWLRSIASPRFSESTDTDWISYYERARDDTNISQGSLAFVELLIVRGKALELTKQDFESLKNIRDLLEQRRKTSNPDYGQSLVVRMASDLAWAMGPFLFRDFSFSKRKTVKSLQKLEALFSEERRATSLSLLGLPDEPFSREIISQMLSDVKLASRVLKWEHRFKILRPAFIAYMLAVLGAHPIDVASDHFSHKRMQYLSYIYNPIMLSDFFIAIESRTHAFSDSLAPGGEKAVRIFVDSELINNLPSRPSNAFIETDPTKGVSELYNLRTGFPNIQILPFSSAQELGELIRTNAGGVATLVMLHGDASQPGRMVIGKTAEILKAEDLPRGAIPSQSCLGFISCNSGMSPSTPPQDLPFHKITDQLGTNFHLTAIAPLNTVGFGTEWKKSLSEEQLKFAESIRSAELEAGREEYELRMQLARSVSGLMKLLGLLGKGLGLHHGFLAGQFWATKDLPTSLPSTPGLLEYNQASGTSTFIPIAQRPVVTIIIESPGLPETIPSDSK